MYPRHAIADIEVAMTDTPVVCLLGSRQTGKSTLARFLTPGRAYYSFDDAETYRLAQSDPSGFVASLPEKVTLDEIQRVPELLPVIKMTVDRKRTSGRFLMTGSANLLLLPKVCESLAGRMEIVYLYPLTEAEKSHQPGRFLQNFLEGKIEPQLKPETKAPDGGADLARRIVEGGYPEPLRRAPARARQWHRNYVQAILQRDVNDVSEVRNRDELGRLMAMLALRTGELINTSNLASDLGMARATVEHYLGVLERLFLVYRLPAWHSSEARRLVRAPKLHIVDSGLAAALAHLSAEDWMRQRPRFGHLLETFVLHQLRAQAACLDSDLRFSFYRDKDQIEVDVVINHGPKVWGVEIKASASLAPTDAHGLRRLAAQAGRNFQGGLLLHAGAHTMRLTENGHTAIGKSIAGTNNLFAAPLSTLWEM